MPRCGPVAISKPAQPNDGFYRGGVLNSDTIQSGTSALQRVILSVASRHEGILTVNLLESFVTLWIVIDPIGTIPVFIAVTASMTAGKRRVTAFLATVVSIGVLLFFLIFGQLLIDALGISLLSFQVAGGIVLFIFALTMIFGESKPETDRRSTELDGELGATDWNRAVCG